MDYRGGKGYLETLERRFVCVGVCNVDLINYNITGHSSSQSFTMCL